MNKKLVYSYLIITFILMFIGFGGTSLICNIYNIELGENIISYILYVIGGFSPTIGSFISLKITKQVKNIKDWLKKIFDIKHSYKIYLLIIAYVFIYFFIGSVINGYVSNAPIFMAFVLIPLMFFGGGNEEVGWRMILTPELEKKFGFILTILIVSLIWWLWHGFLFLIPGTSNESMNYLCFGLMCLNISIGMSVIKKLSNGVFPCMLYHSMINGLSVIFTFNETFLSSFITLGVTIIFSIIILKFYNISE